MTTEVATHETTETPEALLPGLKLGTVHLIVSDLERSASWYEHALGLRVHERGAEVSPWRWNRNDAGPP